MSFFRQSTDQARQVFSAMPLQSRIISLMLIAAIAIGLAFLVRGNDSTNNTYLFGGRVFDQQDLDAMEVAFSSAGVKSKWERVGRRIKVPADSQVEFIAALSESTTLPGSLRSRMQTAFDEASVFESQDQRHSRELEAKKLNLADDFAAFPDISHAKVEYDKGERLGFSRTRQQSASVILYPEGSAPLERHRIAQVRELVQKAFAGLKYEDVAVIDVNSTASGVHGDEIDPVLRKQREAESRVEQKIRSLLVGYPARIAVSAEIDPTMDVQKTTVTYDPEPTTVASSTRKVESSTNRPLAGGVPGAASNGLAVNRPLNLEESAEIVKTKEDQRETAGVPGWQNENSRIASLQVKRISVSVALPRSYYKSIYGHQWLSQNPQSSAADMPPLDDTKLEELRTDTQETIQSAIAVLLPEVAAGEDRFPLVKVTDYFDVPEPLLPEPATSDLAMTWLAESWQSIAMIMLALTALLVARSAIRGGVGDSTPNDFNEGFGLELPSSPVETDHESSEAETMTITGGSLKDELVNLVEKNPEVAANVIRGWVGDAA